MAAVQRVEYVTSQAGEQQILHEGYRYSLNVRRQVATHWMQGSLQYRWRSPPCGDRTESSTRIRSPVSSYESTETPSVGRCDTCPADLSKLDFCNDTSRRCQRFILCKRQFWTLLPPEKRSVSETTDTTRCEPGRDLDRNNRRMCVDDGQKENILIYATDQMLDKIQKVETLFMDGTFYLYPGLWYQVYSIHCLLDDVMCHVAYALLPLKSKETYVRLFTLINAAAHTRIGTKRAPRVIQTDFVVAAIQAAQEVFPGADIRGYFCFFHFSQAVEECRRERPCSRVQDQA